ncbi:MAG: hypothetical protein Q8P76_01755 [bacterium]|nr:hypothetical protein [bacterium]
MAKNRHGLAGKPSLDVLGPLQDIIRQAREGKITGLQLQLFAEHKNPFEKVRSVADGLVRLFVDYTRPLANMIKEDGRFDYVNSDITEKNFQINRRPNGEAEMKVYHFNRDIDSDEAIREMDKEGYRPAELPEGLAYAKANPDEQRKYPIVLLGSLSVWRGFIGDRRVPCLCGVGVERDLDLGWFCGGWDSRCRFLAVRK